MLQESGFFHHNRLITLSNQDTDYYIRTDKKISFLDSSSFKIKGPVDIGDLSGGLNSMVNEEIKWAATISGQNDIIYLTKFIDNVPGTPIQYTGNTDYIHKEVFLAFDKNAMPYFVTLSLDPYDNNTYCFVHGVGLNTPGEFGSKQIGQLGITSAIICLDEVRFRNIHNSELYVFITTQTDSVRAYKQSDDFNVAYLLADFYPDYFADETLNGILYKNRYRCTGIKLNGVSYKNSALMTHFTYTAKTLINSVEY